MRSRRRFGLSGKFGCALMTPRLSSPLLGSALSMTGFCQGSAETARKWKREIRTRRGSRPHRTRPIHAGHQCLRSGWMARQHLARTSQDCRRKPHRFRSRPSRVAQSHADFTWRSVSGGPRLVVAGGRGAAAARQRRAGGPVGRRGSRHVGKVRLFPLVRFVGLFGRGNIDGVMQPAMP